MGGVRWAVYGVRDVRTRNFHNNTTMALIKPVNGIEPQFGKNCYLAENATIVGDVIMGDDCSVWFQAVVRGDVHYIRMGNKVNIQDGAVIHCTYKRAPTNIGNNVSIGHRAIVHGCTLMDNVLVGMGAIVMDHAVVEENVLIAAGRQLAHRVAQLMSDGGGAAEASMAKAYICRAAEWVAREALQIHGGMGYAEEYAVSRYYVDARVLSIFEGADETLCLKVITRNLVKRSRG